MARREKRRLNWGESPSAFNTQSGNRKKDKTTRNSKIEKNEMGGVCGGYGGWERCAQGSDW